MVLRLVGRFLMLRCRIVVPPTLQGADSARPFHRVKTFPHQSSRKSPKSFWWKCGKVCNVGLVLRNVDGLHAVLLLELEVLLPQGVDAVNHDLHQLHLGVPEPVLVGDVVSVTWIESGLTTTNKGILQLFHKCWITKCHEICFGNIRDFYLNISKKKSLKHFRKFTKKNIL